MASNEYPHFIATCPRCSNKLVTFEAMAQTKDYDVSHPTWEVFGLCRKCSKPSIFRIKQEIGNAPYFSDLKGDFIEGCYAVLDVVVVVPDAGACPAHSPPTIQRLFDEATRCLAVQCYDASGTMFRKVLDTATRGLLPAQPDDDGHSDFIAWKTRKDTGLRLKWLFDRGRLPENLRELATCVREDGNDAAHDPAGIDKPEAEDLRDFTVVLLETLYTIPGQIAENQRRRDARRAEF